MSKKTKKSKENEPIPQPSSNPTPPPPPQFDSIPFKFVKDENGKTDAHFEVKEGIKRREALLKTLGMKDTEIAMLTLHQASLAMRAYEDADMAYNLIAQSIHDFEPKDAIEARLVAQATVAYTGAMNALKKFARAEMQFHGEYYGNMAIKLMRVHNETVDVLSRHRRGGEQRVVVQHNVVADKAIVNNFQGGGVEQKNQGESPCSKSAEPKREQTSIEHVASQQWVMEDVVSTADLAQAQRPKKDGAGS